MAKNYYVILGVEPDATQERIRAAYRSKVKELHPDYYGKDSRPFLAVQEAYDVLSDPARRRVYDEQLAGEQRRRKPASPATNFENTIGRLRVSSPPIEPLIPTGPPIDIADPPGRFFTSLETMFDQLLRDMTGLPPIQPASPSQEVQLDVFLSPAQARRGGRVQLRLPVETVCPVCRGSGGRGFYECRECLGVGVIQKVYPLLLTIPAGVSNQDSVRIPLDRLGLSDTQLVLHFRTYTR
jgi:molecular chaperone DnaJ